MFRQEVGLSSF